MTKNLIIPALMGMAALVSSCGKSEVENVYTQQDKNIESLVKSLAPEESEATVDYLDGVVRVTVKHGDECYIMFNGKYGFGKHTNGTVPGNSALAYHLWISSVSN